MGFNYNTEIISASYPSILDDLNRIKKISNIFLSRVNPDKHNTYTEIIDNLLGLISTYLVDGLILGDSFIDRDGLNKIIEKLNGIKAIRIISRSLPKNVIINQGIFIITEYPEKYPDMSSFDSIVLDFLSEFGYHMIPYNENDYKEFASSLKDELLKQKLGFHEQKVIDGLKTIMLSVAEDNAMSVFVNIKSMKKSPFPFSASDFTSLFAKALDIVGDTECSDTYAMGKISESIFRGDFLEKLKVDLISHPKELVTMLSILGDIYNALYGDGKNASKVFEYYALLLSCLKIISQKKSKIDISLQ